MNPKEVISKDAVRYAEVNLFEMANLADNPAPIFILSAPRTGSTFQYQAITRIFGLPYISNLTNEFFPETPIVGLALQRGVKTFISDRSNFGKTKGPFQPSEGSGPMSYWFGGGHPSQLVSTSIIQEREDHFISTLAACEVIYDGAPLVIKNSWNCFRCKYLSTRLPGARFIWIKRDILDAATSDLEARYLTKGDANAWNSATPSNVEALRKLPPAHQVVENQYEFNQAISAALFNHAAGRWMDVWYEDLVRNPGRELGRVAHFLNMRFVDDAPVPRALPKRKRAVCSGESVAIYEYINASRERFAQYCYA